MISEETRRKMSEARKRWHQRHPDQSKIRARISSTLRTFYAVHDNPRLGVHLSQQEKDKISQGTKAGMSRDADRIKRQISEMRRQHPNPFLGKKHTLQTRKIISAKRQGVELDQWLGFSKSESDRIRASSEYKQWRQEVFKRDDYTCQMCSQRGGELHADHIKPFCKFIELRFEVSNGRTLCVTCHRKTPTYGQLAKCQF